MKEMIFDEENNEIKNNNVVENDVDDAFAKAEDEEEVSEEDKQGYAFLGKWIWYLFILIIPSIAAAIFSAIPEAPIINFIGKCLDIACDVAYVVILIIMGTYSVNYKKAGYFQILAIATTIISAIVWGTEEVPLWYNAIELVAGVLGIYGMYLEFKTHAEAIAPIDIVLSDKWNKLFKLFAIATIGTLCSVFLLLIPVLGVLCLLGFVVLLVVVTIMKIIYLYSSAKEFQATAL